MPVKSNRRSGAVLITGASSGIGKACAVHLDKLGFSVFAGVRRETDADALRRISGRIQPLILDVLDHASIAEARDQVAAAGNGRLAGLVNNAGIVVGGPIEFLPLESIRNQIDVNLLGQIAVTQAFLPLLREGRGRIINMGSISGRIASPFLGPYAASKYALEAVTDALRMELLPWGISVSIIEPGSVATPIWKKSADAAERTAADFPSQALDLYGTQLKAAGAAAGKAERRGIPAERVARTVEHALTAERPRARYSLGRGTRMEIVLKKVLPDRMFDRLLLKAMGLPHSA